MNVLTEIRGTAKSGDRPTAEPVPRPRLTLAVTGHRSSHPSFSGDGSALKQQFRTLFDRIDAILADCSSGIEIREIAATRLHTLTSDGTDQIAAHLALDRNWDLIVPLPFGRAVNAAINARPMDAAELRRTLAGEPVSDAGAAKRIAAIEELSARASLFELADDDARIAAMLLAASEPDSDPAAQKACDLAAGARAAMAGRILIEQSDLLIAVWDGQSTADVGGTGHTVAAALELGVPVLWIDSVNFGGSRLLQTPESLVGCGSALSETGDDAALAAIVRSSILPEAPKTTGSHIGTDALNAARWRDHSSLSAHAFRRIEALFGAEGLAKRLGTVRQDYERPSEISAGTSASLLSAIHELPSGDAGLADRIGTKVLRRFAWADGISAYISDRYRSGMTINFLLGSFAIIAGILYLPLVDTGQKWLFASAEFLLLLMIITITIHGTRQRLHGRWFETRRAAEYLRHSPLLLAMGVARPAGKWPRGTKSFWPEWYARHSMRAVGLPAAKIGKPYLQTALAMLRDHHVLPQRDYHHRKARQLNRVHEGLDHLSALLFIAAVMSVAIYLSLVAAGTLGLIEGGWVTHVAKAFTVLGVGLPTLGGAFAGIRYFGDFERFAAISEVAAERLTVVADRIALLQSAPVERLEYRHVAELIHAADDVVFSEIQNWQAVFSGKKITVPA